MELGTIRQRKAFAWIPMMIGDWSLWLEFYIIQEACLKEANSPAKWVELRRFQRLESTF